MASLPSPRGRERQLHNSGSPQPRHRSESSRLSDRKRPTEEAVGTHVLCLDALHEGDPVQVFSRSLGQWVGGEIVKTTEDDFAPVEYEVGDYRYGKSLHLCSELLKMPDKDTCLTVPVSGRMSFETVIEHDPDFCATWAIEAKKKLGENSTGKAHDIAQSMLDQALRVSEILATEHSSHQAKYDLLEMEAKGIDGAAQLIRANKMRVKLPSFLKSPAQILSTTKRLQMRAPTKWALSFDDWNTMINECKGRKVFDELKRKKPFDKFVSVYDINDYFVKPWTRGTGCGIALHMNPDGLEAEVMLSHAWAEDVEECQSALEDAHIDGRAAVWFCTFAQYQPDDKSGPTIKQQLECVQGSTPFKCVIESPAVKQVLAIHWKQQA